MRNVKEKPFPDYVFSKMIDKDEDFKRKFGSWNYTKAAYEARKSYSDIHSDFFTSLHENKFEVKSDANDVFKKFIGDTENKTDWKSMKSSTQGNQVMSYYMAKELYEQFQTVMDEAT
jgi:hypothetical protein